MKKEERVPTRKWKIPLRGTNKIVLGKMGTFRKKERIELYAENVK